MAWGVVFWSIATFLTPWAARHSTAMLLAVRALFGLAEGVAIPSMSTHLFRWFPCNERASAVGIAMAGFHLGNVMSLLVSPIILSSVGINGTFAFFASLGFVWLSAWIGRIPNDPRDSPDISHSELQLIRAGKIDSKAESSQLPPLRHLFSKLPALAVVLANVANNWVYNVNLKQAAWFSAVPFGVMALSGYLAGASSDLMIKSGCSIIHVRKLMQTIGFIGPAVSLLSLKYAQTPISAAVLMTMALSFSAFSQAGYFLNIQCWNCCCHLHKHNNSRKIDN
ncbi:Sugar transporter [Musa troglodytarum]|uniref:Sugar transporter n=1 Tax=Musa troglodytarum TaxID=320322 RepID=A0A9E7EMI7_9LILI|nr:Sugar transporter [Musa troglodytarum]